jgi:RNA 3'-terminal phosphate cyclase (ATP)
LLTIDGSHGEGGGQVLRTAVSLSATTGQPVRIERIRAGRRNPGLRPQHLTAARAAAAVCGARLEGDGIGSQALSFVPGHRPRAGEYDFDVASATRGGSAGSVALVLQTALIPLAFAGGHSTITVRGGTHVPWAPSIFYVEHVYTPSLAQMGITLQTALVQWGFYPAGGGEARAEIHGSEQHLRPLVSVDRGHLEGVSGVAVAMNLPSHIPQRMSTRAVSVLAQNRVKARVDPLRVRGRGPGAAICLAAQYAHGVAGFTAYGRRGLPSEQVADTACRALLDHHRTGAPVDRHLADQLVLPMALAAGRSELEVAHLSQHLRTNAWVVEQFLGVEIGLDPGSGGGGRLFVEGIGL